MKTNPALTRTLLVSLLAMTGLGVGACASSQPRHTVSKTERVYRDSDEVCRQKVVTEQRRERDGDRSRVATSETTCRDR